MHVSTRRLWGAGALVALVCALLVVPTVASAGLPPTPPITPVFPPWVLPVVSASLPATVTGTVTDSVGNPISGVNVEIYGDTSSTALTAQSFVQRAQTGVDGVFVIPDVIQGTYQLVVNNPDLTPYSSIYREEYVWHDEMDGTVIDTRHNVIGGTTVDAGTIQLTRNGRVRGYATDGVTPVEGSEIAAYIKDPVTNIPYWRWATTGADGSFQISNAPPGDWTLTYSAALSKVPDDAQVNRLGDSTVVGDDQPVCYSAPIEFSLAAASSKLDANKSFQTGTRVVAHTYETAYGSSYNVGNTMYTFAPSADPSDTDHTFYAQTADDGWIRFWLPPGTYDVTVADGMYDPYPMYESDTEGGVVCASGATVTNATLPSELTPAENTRAIHGEILESGSADTYVQSWVVASPVAPAAAGWQWPYRRLLSNGTGANAMYLFRVPTLTGFSGNQVKLEFYDKKDAIPGTTVQPSPTHLAQAITVGGSTDTTRNISVPVGASISGRVTDEAGDPVEGVSVSARRKGVDPSMPDLGMTWLNSVTPNTSPWVTLTDASGNYTIGGLPPDADYKVTYNPDYNPGWPLDIKYRDYNRFVYNSAPLADGFDSMATPPVHDHDPVNVPSAGFARTGIDTTITPGGYVAIHADGPEYPTGAVYCDVMYQVTDAVTGSGTAWAEVDSGFTTGGTFQKISKVLPAGTYRLDYSDYFGRGAGSWAFGLAGGDHAYNSIIVPVPMVAPSSSTKTSSPLVGSPIGVAPVGFASPQFLETPNLGASFAGEINDGLMDGGTGGLTVSAVSTVLPTPTPARPTNCIPAGGVYEFAAHGALSNGTWTLTMPYSSSVPSFDASKLRVRRFIEGGGTPVTLVPFTRNTSKRTLQVQTTDLGEFEVMFLRTKVSLSKPSVSTSSPKRYRAFTVYGTLSPRHAAGASTVRLTIYKYSNSKHRYVYYTRTYAKNYNYRTSQTLYKKSLKLPAGSYRIYAYTPADTWHLATSASTYRSVRVR